MDRSDGRDDGVDAGVTDTMVAPDGRPAAREGAGPPTDHADLASVDPAHYSFEGEIARGGMGVVRCAHDRRIGRPVAIKELLASSAVRRARFEREARITAQLQHPSIVPVYELGRWPDGRPFYAMKLVGGRPLDVVVDEALDDAARLALIPRILPAVEAIAYAHEHGVIHRDLKPANVLLGEFGETVVIDWGLARGIDEPDDHAEAAGEPARPPSVDAVRTAEKLTVDGAVIGTPAYMPPEQARGERLDARADVYALGALLYHALCGRPPHEGPSPRAILVSLLTEPPPPLARLAPGAPPDLVGIVEKAMAPDPRDRYRDAQALARDLEAFTTGRLVGAYHYSSWELVTRFVRRNRALSSAIAALIVLAVAGGGAITEARLASERARERAVAAERRALAQERAAHERLAQVHWREAVRRLQHGDHLAAEVLAAGALLEQPLHPAGPYRALSSAVPEATVSTMLAGPSATWAAARALRFARRERELGAQGDWIYDVLPSPDGRFVVTTAGDGRAVVWNARDGGAHRTLEGHRGVVFQASLDRTATTLATSGYDGTVRLWSFPDGEPLRTITHPAGRVYGICHAASGQLAAAAIDGTLALIDPATGEITARVAVTGALPWRLHCHPREPIAVLGSSGVDVAVVDLEAPRVVHRLTHEGSFVHCATLSADGAEVFTADKLGALRRFDRATGAETGRAQIGGECESLATSPDGRFLAVGTHEITIVDAATLRAVARLDGHRAAVAGLAFGRSGRRLYSGGLDRRVVEWAVVPNAGRSALVAPTASEVDTLVFSPDGRMLATGGDDRTLRLWDLASGREGRAIELHSAPIRGVAFLDRSRVVTSAMDRTLRIHSLGEGEPERVLDLPHFGDEVSLAPGGSLLAVWIGDGSVLLVDAASGAQPRIAPVHGARAWWVGFDPSGERLASASFGGEVALIDPARGVVDRRFHAGEARIYDADWRPDGGELTTADLAGFVRGWDPATAQPVREWRVPQGEQALSLAWSPDGRWLLVTTDEGMRLFRPDGTLQARLDLGARTRGAAWTPDGRMAFASQGRVFVLPLDTGASRADPARLLGEAERASGFSLSSLIGLAPVEPEGGR